MQWYQSDSEENYRTTNSGSPNYTSTEFDYKFNRNGYRCEDFDLYSESPILYMGCSITEGVGLPINEVWAHHLHTDFCNSSKKNIPFWSIAKGGTGIDYASRCLYEFNDKLKPKNIFYLMSGISRREYSYQKNEFEQWFPYRSKNYKPSDNFLLLEKIFVDPYFAYYQAYRSAMIINSVAEKYKTNVLIFGLDMDYNLGKDKRKELFSNFSNIKYFEVSEINVRPISVPDPILKKPQWARDNQHYGALWHYLLYQKILKVIKNEVTL